LLLADGGKDCWEEDCGGSGMSPVATRSAALRHDEKAALELWKKVGKLKI
jgi:hypothetical protein